MTQVCQRIRTYPPVFPVGTLLIITSYVARGCNDQRISHANRAQKLEFYWSSSLEVPCKSHVYWVAKHLDPNEGTPTLKKRRPPSSMAKSSCSSSASLQIQTESDSEIPKTKQSRAKSGAGTLTQRSRTESKPRGTPRWGSPSGLSSSSRSSSVRSPCKSRRPKL
jgi:hypothetical protein